MSDIITLDFETYFGTGYSLRGLSYTDYITDERFAYTGLTIKINTTATEFIEPQDISHVLQGFTWGRGETVVAHNIIFDGLVLRLREGIEASHYFCTLAAARNLMPEIPHDLGTLARLLGLGEKNKAALAAVNNRYYEDLDDSERESFIQYNIDDTNQCHGLYQVFHPRLTPGQRHQMDYTYRMALHPRLQLDESRAQRALDDTIDERRQIIKASGYTLEQLRSREQFADILRSHSVDPPTKLNDKGDKTYAFAKNDLGFLELYRHEQLHPILDAKSVASSNIDTTRLQSMIRMHQRIGALPACYKWSGAHTGRVSGDNKVNFANFRRGSEMRKSIVAPPGHVLVVVDSSQIEARKNAENANETYLVELFKAGGDPYNDMATRLYNRPVERKRKAMDEHGNYLDINGSITDKDNAHEPDFIAGHVGKACVLGLGYQMGWRKLQNQMAIGMLGGPRINLTDAEAQNTVNIYRTTNRNIAAFWNVAQQMIEAMILGREMEWKNLRVEGKAIRLPSGRLLQYPGIRCDEETDNYIYGLDPAKPKKIYGGLCCENIIQSTSHDIVAWQGEQIDPHYKLVMQTYDELVACVPEDRADEAYKFMMEVMTTPPPFDPNVPLAAEGGWAREYSK